MGGLAPLEFDYPLADFSEIGPGFCDGPHRKTVGPFAGYLGSELPAYPETTFNLHVVAHLRDDGIRPLVTVSRSAHPLYREQCQGMTAGRLSEIYEAVMHGQ
jgi:hypothetical protein